MRKNNKILECLIKMSSSEEEYYDESGEQESEDSDAPAQISDSLISRIVAQDCPELNKLLDEL